MGAADGPADREPAEKTTVDDGVAVDPLPSTGSLRWADDAGDPAASPVAGPGGDAVPGDSGTRAGAGTSDTDTREVRDPLASPWDPPSGPPLGDTGRAAGGPSGAPVWQPPPGRPYGDPGGAPGGSSSGSWAPPSGPPLDDARSAAGGAYRPPGSSGPPPTGPRHVAGAHGPGPRPPHRRQRSETVVLATVGVIVVVVGVAAMALGRDGDDPPAAEEPTSTTVALAGDGSDPTGPIVGPTGVVGWWSGTAWVPRAEGEMPESDVDLELVGLSGAEGSARGMTVGEECASQRGTAELDVSVELAADGGGPPPVAVAGVPQPQPRPVEVTDPGSPTYQQAAVEVATGLGAAAPPTATIVVRGDLDGSGTDEAVVVAEHLGDPDAPAAGDWSVVFLRRVVGDGVATDVLASSVAGAGGDGFERVRLSAVADLNADGTMELVVDGRPAEGQWTAVHALGGDGVPAEVLREGCEG